ncbi:zinc-binding dehydrogenase [candidate division KSB3 bacterium]|uniref:Zinc-binding dehydrogenase n=1 Tax=candidate division KSB3 bacterium TaxID=2044937 RepID=A0A9D5JTJ0_9BACT|nr:zinc-binding dehydrogenase [candidate division KSB3 bacterium]MBD3323736.1 zinc-binding dehydrogenase [candidate division KSB3 bacterium]
MKRYAVLIQQPYQIAIQEASVETPGAGEVLVQTQFSAISAGTELLVYRGQIPAEMQVDTTISALAGTFQYPLKYGYTVVGKVIALGARVDPDLLGRRVFCFHPHETAFLAASEDLVFLPDDLDARDALFLPNMETAVNFLMDGRPLIGERVVVFGEGIVGLLTTALLAQFPLAALAGVDPYALRRETALTLGADAVYDPQDADLTATVQAWLMSRSQGEAADLVYELSGNPQALNAAIQIAGFHARVIVGSWYGTKPATLDLGGDFHRSRIRLISSQVSSLAPECSGRWTTARRLEVALRMLNILKPSRLITHTFPFDQAAQAFDLLNTRPEQALQVVLTYQENTKEVA